MKIESHRFKIKRRASATSLLSVIPPRLQQCLKGETFSSEGNAYLPKKPMKASCANFSEENNQNQSETNHFALFCQQGALDANKVN
jgi:hypothetical protein